MPYSSTSRKLFEDEARRIQVLHKTGTVNVPADPTAYETFEIYVDGELVVDIGEVFGDVNGRFGGLDGVFVSQAVNEALYPLVQHMYWQLTQLAHPDEFKCAECDAPFKAHEPMRAELTCDCYARAMDHPCASCLHIDTEESCIGCEFFEEAPEQDDAELSIEAAIARLSAADLPVSP